MAQQPPGPGRPALDRVLDRLYGGPTRENEAQVSVGVTAGIVAARDIERVILIFVNLSATQSVFLSPTPQVSATRGIRIGPQGGLVAMDVWEDAHFPTLEWSGVADVAGATVYVLSARREQLFGPTPATP